MPYEIVMKGVPGGLMASNKIEADKLDRFLGREIMVKVTQGRNLAFHRKFFALLGVGLDMCDTEFNAEQFRAVCITGAGHCDYVEHKGTMVAIPRSISFAKMDEAEFETLYQDVLTFICRNWAVDDATLNQVLQFM